MKRKSKNLIVVKAIKYFTGITYKPLVVKYLSKVRWYNYGGIRLVIPPEVFHPGFFFSTKLLLRHLMKFPLKEKTFLELGAGSGLISMLAAKAGAKVTASDINSVAVDYLKKNCKENNIQLDAIHSDLFKNIPLQHFDFIAINPPYYKRKPQTAKDYAWCCGENGEYFAGLFSSLANYMHASSKVFMILCDGCDFEMINSIAAANNFQLNCVFTKRNLIEQNFIYQIEQK